MTIEELDVQVDIMLRHLMVTFRKFPALNGMATRFIVEDFGVAVCVMERMDYTQIRDLTERDYSGYRKVFIAVEDSLKEKRYETIWELMKSGYMKWIRMNFKRQFDNLITMQNFGNMIIDQRLKIWNGEAKYKFMIDDNEDARRRASSFILTREPAFFDTMPE
jgi:hypothetical protein